MNREIKFRVFVEKTQEMLTWSKLQAIKQFALDDGIKPKDVILIPVNDKTHMMQYTGLKDRNTVEVFESDILSGLGLIMKVIWSEEDCAFLMATNTGQAFINQEYLDNFKVIGNIYENPELLETK